MCYIELHAQIGYAAVLAHLKGWAPFAALLWFAAAPAANAANLAPAYVTKMCAKMQPELDLSRYAGRQVRVKHPGILQYAAPHYPNIAAHSIHRLVSVCVLVNEYGHPEQLKILYSSGYKKLDDAAYRAAQKTTFMPGTLNGQPIKMSTELDYAFDLK